MTKTNAVAEATNYVAVLTKADTGNEIELCCVGFAFVFTNLRFVCYGINAMRSFTESIVCTLTTSITVGQGFLLLMYAFAQFCNLRHFAVANFIPHRIFGVKKTLVILKKLSKTALAYNQFHYCKCRLERTSDENRRLRNVRLNFLKITLCF